MRPSGTHHTLGTERRISALFWTTTQHTQQQSQSNGIETSDQEAGGGAGPVDRPGVAPPKYPASERRFVRGQRFNLLLNHLTRWRLRRKHVIGEGVKKKKKREAELKTYAHGFEPVTYGIEPVTYTFRSTELHVEGT